MATQNDETLKRLANDWIKYGDVCARNINIPMALKAYDNALETYSEDPVTLLKLAVRQVNIGYQDEAAKTIGRISRTQGPLALSFSVIEELLALSRSNRKRHFLCKMLCDAMPYAEQAWHHRAIVSDALGWKQEAGRALYKMWQAQLAVQSLNSHRL
jgi:tetratricopeptide (TPR) repeat protein